jgi:hypothetical protein
MKARYEPRGKRGIPFAKGHCWVFGAPLFRLVGAWTRYSHSCSRECRKMVDFEEFATLKFLLINSRWFGGAGFRTLEHRMEEAVRNLPISSDLLADLLITILEIQDRDEAKKVDARISLDTAALGCCEIAC